ncbi:hypothetical protein [Luteimonas sp. A501]
MTAADYVAALARLYGMDSDALRRNLPDLGDGLHAQLVALHDAPSQSACEHLASNLEGARRYVLRLAEAIRTEVARGDA